MNDQDAQRAYLRAALNDAGADLKEASLAIGRNQAYIQQYVSKGVPQYLSEVDRDALVALYKLDGDKLKPPPRPTRPRPSRRGLGVQDGIDALQQAENEELLRVWSRLDNAIKIAILTFIKAMLEATESNAA